MDLNYEINEDTVDIEIDVSVFTKEVLMRTAYKYIDKAWMSIKRGEEENMFILSVLPRDPEERNSERLEDLALRFNTDIICTFVEEKEAERYAESRNAMVKAAMLSQTRKT